MELPSPYLCVSVFAVNLFEPVQGTTLKDEV
jgi:hypothetical protein